MKRTYLWLTIGLVMVITGCQPSQPINTAAAPTTTNAAAKPIEPVKPAVTQPSGQPAGSDSNPVKPTAATPTTTKPMPVQPPSAKAINYPVPFTSQAPYAVWDDLHEETCEEAAMLMVDAYYNHKTLAAHDAEQAILTLVKWESDQGYSVDVTAAETVAILTKYFNLKAEVVTTVTVDRIKQELTAGHLVIVPAAGRLLGNPYYQQPGPIYHQLVIRGFDEKNFITNDAGTKHGEGFSYRYDTLLNAIHDWDHQRATDGMTDQEMEQGSKVMVVVSP